MTVQPAGATAAELAAAIAMKPTPAKNITGGVTAVGRQWGVVISIQTTTLTITLAGGSTPIAGVAYMASYSPNVGDTVIIDQVGTDLVAVGGLYGAVATSLTAGASVGTLQSTSSGSYTNLGTVGPAVTLLTDTSVTVIVSSWVQVYNLNQVGYVSFAVSGATTIAAADNNGGIYQDAISATMNGIATMAVVLTTLTPGSNTFTMKYRTSSGSADFYNRNLVVIPN